MSMNFGHHEPEKPEQDEQPENPFKVLNRSQINEIQELSPLIGTVLDKGTVSMLAAQPAAGKTFLALDWAARYACGLDWQHNTMDSTIHHDGQRVDGKVLYVAAEGGRTIKGRLAAWEEHWGQQVPSSRFRMVGQPVNLGSPGNVGKFIQAMEDTGPYGLVVFDTIARCTLGLEENSATDMGQVVEALYRVRDAMGDDGTVLAIHHHGKSGTARGSSALLGGVDQLMNLTRDGEVLELEDEKRKDAAELEPVHMRLHPVGGSLVVVPEALARAVLNPLAKAMRDELRHTLPLTKSELIKATDLTERQVYRYLNEGLESGEIVVANKGAQNPRYEVDGGLI